ncbi:MAG: hemolysin family protein [Treponema sp.]|nr:hemolysin family protein [Treponema sp.]
MNPKSVVKSIFRKDTELDKKAFESLEADQKEMIQGIVELSFTTVKEVMVPRIDTVFISSDISREELFALVTEGGHSRFPVYEETIDNVIGILYVKDLLMNLVAGDPPDAPFDIRKLSRKPFFVPDSKRLDELLREFRRRKLHIAIVVDEYGGVSGIVCMENIIEEIIGDIQDEFDNEKEDILELGGGVWLCDARVNLEDLSDRLGIDMPVEDFDTLGGLVFDLFGKIPVKYEKAVWNGHDFIIQDVEGHKINSVKIVLGKKEE